LKIVDHLISTLDLNASVRDIRQGVFHTAVWSRNCGLAATLFQHTSHRGEALVNEPGFLLDKTPKELVRLAYSDRILEAAMGMAAINSLLEIDEACCLELNAADLIISKGDGKRIAIVGHFPFSPLLLRGCCFRHEGRRSGDGPTVRQSRCEFPADQRCKTFNFIEKLDNFSCMYKI